MQICKNIYLKKRTLKNGMVSLSLDYYPGYRDPETGRVVRQEALNIYIYAKAKTQREKDYNATMLEKAEAVRCMRFQDVVNGRYGFLDKNRYKGDFLEYYRQKIEKKNDTKPLFAYKHFEIYCHGKCYFEELDVDFCNGFREYLLGAHSLKHPDEELSVNSASAYWGSFRSILKLAYVNDRLPKNLNDYLERIKEEDVVKDYLSMEELWKLAETDCRKPQVKSAALFACLTSLRISDIMNLHWQDIKDYSLGGKCVHIVTQKTKSEDIIPVSNEAVAVIGYDENVTLKGKVFAGLRYSQIHKPMKEWLDAAGITKHITFHSFRRTFATLQAAAGTDVNTIRQLMAHKNITTTQRYMKVVDPNMLNATNRITLQRPTATE